LGDKKAKILNPLLETLGLIYMTRNFEAAKADILDALEKRNIDSRQFYKQYLSYLENYVHEFESACVLNPTEEFFFEYNTEFFLTAAATATELFKPDPDMGIKRLEKQQILSTLAELCRKEGSGNGMALNTLEDWFAVLQNSEYAEDTKWKLLALFQDPVGKFRDLFGIYENNRAAFEHTYQKNKAHLDRLISEAPEDLSAAMQNIAAEFHPMPKRIYLTAILPLIEWMTPTTIFQGVLADKIDLYQNNLKNAKEKLPQLLKLLGDKSKFEILCLLKSHGKYNLEIAEELQLTPATASHHMSMLLSNQMVTVEKKDGKVYYQLNQDTLKEIMKCFEEIFL
jgi:DNA-binding transcriptional ArsR family regulator